MSLQPPPQTPCSDALLPPLSSWRTTDARERNPPPGTQRPTAALGPGQFETRRPESSLPVKRAAPPGHSRPIGILAHGTQVTLLFTRRRTHYRDLGPPTGVGVQGTPAPVQAAVAPLRLATSSESLPLPSPGRRPQALGVGVGAWEGTRPGLQHDRLGPAPQSKARGSPHGVLPTSCLSRDCTRILPIPHKPLHPAGS